jgi:predicted TIM-barrel fold metal-dependent hydrolase
MWESKSEMEYFNKIDLTEKERSQILWENAYKLLGLD